MDLLSCLSSDDRSLLESLQLPDKLLEDLRSTTVDEEDDNCTLGELMGKRFVKALKSSITDSEICRKVEAMRVDPVPNEDHVMMEPETCTLCDSEQSSYVKWEFDFGERVFCHQCLPKGGLMSTFISSFCGLSRAVAAPRGPDGGWRFYLASSELIRFNQKALSPPSAADRSFGEEASVVSKAAGNVSKLFDSSATTKNGKGNAYRELQNATREDGVLHGYGFTTLKNPDEKDFRSGIGKNPDQLVTIIGKQPHIYAQLLPESHAQRTAGVDIKGHHFLSKQLLLYFYVYFATDPTQDLNSVKAYGELESQRKLQTIFFESLKRMKLLQDGVDIFAFVHHPWWMFYGPSLRSDDPGASPERTPPLSWIYRFGVDLYLAMMQFASATLNLQAAVANHSPGWKILQLATSCVETFSNTTELMEEHGERKYPWMSHPEDWVWDFDLPRLGPKCPCNACFQLVTRKKGFLCDKCGTRVPEGEKQTFFGCDICDTDVCLECGLSCKVGDFKIEKQEIRRFRFSPMSVETVLRSIRDSPVNTWLCSEQFEELHHLREAAVKDEEANHYSLLGEMEYDHQLARRRLLTLFLDATRSALSDRFMTSCAESSFVPFNTNAIDRKLHYPFIRLLCCLIGFLRDSVAQRKKLRIDETKIGLSGTTTQSWIRLLGNAENAFPVVVDYPLVWCAAAHLQRDLAPALPPSAQPYLPLEELEETVQQNFALRETSTIAVEHAEQILGSSSPENNTTREEGSFLVGGCLEKAITSLSILHRQITEDGEKESMALGFDLVSLVSKCPALSQRERTRCFEMFADLIRSFVGTTDQEMPALPVKTLSGLRASATPKRDHPFGPLPTSRVPKELQERLDTIHENGTALLNAITEMAALLQTVNNNHDQAEDAEVEEIHLKTLDEGPPKPSFRFAEPEQVSLLLVESPKAEGQSGAVVSFSYRVHSSGTTELSSPKIEIEQSSSTATTQLLSYADFMSVQDQIRQVVADSAGHAEQFRSTSNSSTDTDFLTAQQEEFRGRFLDTKKPPLSFEKLKTLEPLSVNLQSIRSSAQCSVLVLCHDRRLPLAPLLLGGQLAPVYSRSPKFFGEMRDRQEEGRHEGTTAVFLGSNGMGLTLVTDELQYGHSVMSELGYHSYLRPTPDEPSVRESLDRGLLSTLQCAEFVHICGHSDGQRLFVADGSGSYLTITPQDFEAPTRSRSLLVLSACSTGGMYIAASARHQNRLVETATTGVQTFADQVLDHFDNVVATLYPVPDHVASSLMKHFYTFIKEGEGPAVSLFLAQKEYCKEKNYSGDNLTLDGWEAFICLGTGNLSSPPPSSSVGA